MFIFVDDQNLLIIKNMVKFPTGTNKVLLIEVIFYLLGEN